ncbi:efflux RND transporter periplasmic adaptor subunit [Parvularcula dongshanensis]|uniref:efflux RND transporter periplasmic adaptor subunit n=1 Tax=Parvularcula dongshanensis TaxID=1173995 RepID=UPI00160EF526
MIDGRPALPEPEAHERLPAPERDERASPEGARDRTPFWRRRGVLIGAALLLLALLVLFFLLRGGDGGEEQGQPPPTVSVEEARRVAWNDQLSAVGTLEAIQGVDVTTELGGTVEEISFENGTEVEEGELLVRLDTSTEQAALAALEAQRDQARLAYDRQQRLIERGATAEADVEAARATFEGLAAQAEQTRAAIDKKTIEAPFSGTLGIREVSLGQYVGAGTPVVTLQQIAPIYVNFELPEAAFGLVEGGVEVELQADSFPGRTFAGRITAVSPEIAEETRSVTVQATIPNEDQALRPGMFADVTVLLPGERQVVVVPQTAIARNAYGTAVYVVGPPDPEEQQRQRERGEAAEEEDGGFLGGLLGGGNGEGQGGDASDEEPGQARSGAGQRRGGNAADGQNARGGEGGAPAETGLVAKTVFVETGEQRGLDVEVTEGLQGGERVVTAGQLKLDDGVAVTIGDQDAGEGATERPAVP